MGFLLETTKPDFVTRKEDKKKRQKVRKRKRKKKICEDIDIQEKKKFIRISLDFLFQIKNITSIVISYIKSICCTFTIHKIY